MWTTFDYVLHHGIINIFPIIIFITLAFIVSGSVNGILSLFFLTWWSYIAHVNAHIYFPFKQLHMDYHHVNDTLTSQVIETILDFLTAGGFLFIFLQRLFGLYILNESVILMFAIYYTSTHLINYHDGSSKVHKIHHEKLIKNYGPSIMDIFYGTNDHNTSKEDLLHSVPNIIMGALVALYLQKKKILC